MLKIHRPSFSMGSVHMVSRALGVVAIMVFALQSVGQAEAACQNVEGAVCGGAGKGSLSSVTGNVSLAQGAGVSRATRGASVFPGNRILAGEGGTAQVNLGAGCFVSVGSNSAASFTLRNGATCLRQNEPFTAQTPGNDNNNNTGWIAAGLGLAVIGGVVGLGLSEGSGHNNARREPLRRVRRSRRVGPGGQSIKVANSATCFTTGR
jgi:hypothetical protein